VDGLRQLAVHDTIQAERGRDVHDNQYHDPVSGSIPVTPRDLGLSAVKRRIDVPAMLDDVENALHDVYLLRSEPNAGLARGITLPRGDVGGFANATGVRGRSAAGGEMDGPLTAACEWDVLDASMIHRLCDSVASTVDRLCAELKPNSVLTHVRRLSNHNED
jgi:hypothetical protein